MFNVLNVKYKCIFYINVSQMESEKKTEKTLFYIFKWLHAFRQHITKTLLQVIWK